MVGTDSTSLESVFSSVFLISPNSGGVEGVDVPTRFPPSPSYLAGAPGETSSVVMELDTRLSSGGRSMGADCGGDVCPALCARQRLPGR